MRKIKVLVLLILLPIIIQAQIVNGPPTYCCGPSFTYCEALAHQPAQTTVMYGFFRGRWLIESPCNNTGNLFYGNTIMVGGWGATRTFWYDWSADPHAAAKITTWTSTPWAEPLVVTYDVHSLRVISVTSPSFP